MLSLILLSTSFALCAITIIWILWCRLNVNISETDFWLRLFPKSSRIIILSLKAIILFKISSWLEVKTYTLVHSFLSLQNTTKSLFLRYLLIKWVLPEPLAL